MNFVTSRIACILMASASLLALLGTTVSAQTQVAAADTGSSGIETVIVTATRRAVDKQKVGVSLTALTEEQLKVQAPHTLEDLNGSAPNVFIGLGTAGPAQSAIFIRGQGYADVEKTQSPPVGVMEDGVFFGNNTGQLLDLFDVCSVEVDRGPQGIFYGKNTTAGLINITRCAPTREWGASVSAAYGSYKDEILRGVFNAPLGEDGGIKVSGQYHSNQGYYHDIFTGEHAGGDRYIALNAVVDYDLTSWLNARFSYDHVHDNGGGTPVQFGNILTANILTGGNPAAVYPNYNPETGSPDGLKPYQIENNAHGDTDRYNSNIYSLILKADTPIGQLTSQSAFIDEADNVHQDFDGTCYLLGNLVAPPGCNSVGNPLLKATGSVLETIRDQTYQQFTQEVRLAGSFLDQFDYLLGVFYYHHDIDLHQNTDIAINQFSAEGDFTWSEFGNLDWNVTDKIKLSAGGREINETKHFDTSYFATVPLFGTVPITPHIVDSNSWSKFVTRFNAQWQVTDDTLLYANRSEGFRSGGFSIRGTLSEQAALQTNCGPVACPNNNFLSFAPETNVTYEAGIKNQFFDRSLTFNFDGFINNITGYQQTEVVTTGAYGSGTNTYIVNYPKVRIQGLEFELDDSVGEWAPALDGLILSANVGIQNGKVKDGLVNGQEVGTATGTAGAPGSTADFTGSTLQRLPSDNYTIRGTYSHSVGSDSSIALTAGYSWIAKFSLGTFATGQDIQPSYGLLDASATFNWQNYYIKLSGKNLSDKVYRDQSLPSVFFQGYGAPRTAQVEVGAKF